jgi:hypothetical protein
VFLYDPFNDAVCNSDHQRRIIRSMLSSEMQETRMIAARCAVEPLIVDLCRWLDDVKYKRFNKAREL